MTERVRNSFLFQAGTRFTFCPPALIVGPSPSRESCGGRGVKEEERERERVGERDADFPRHATTDIMDGRNHG